MAIRLLSLLIILSFLSCGKDNREPDPKSQSPEFSPGLNNVKMTSGGILRDLYIQLPASFEPGETYPVVFFFHGLGGLKGFGYAVLGDLVNSEKFIGVYPQGHLNSWNAGSGGVPSTEDDVGFTLEILDLIRQEIYVDTNRIYSMGYSNGGALSYTLALETDVFAAVASLSASFFQGRTVPEDVPKLSVMQIHGENDIVVPFEGGQSYNLPIIFESVMFTVNSWAEHMGLTDDPQITHPEDNVVKYTFREAEIPHEVILLVLEDTNHDIGQNVYISSLRCYSDIWDFFAAHPKVD